MREDPKAGADVFSLRLSAMIRGEVLKSPLRNHFDMQSVELELLFQPCYFSGKVALRLAHIDYGPNGLALISNLSLYRV